MTSINLDISLLKKHKLTPDEYCILWCLFNSVNTEWIDTTKKEDYSYYMKVLKALEEKLWIKILSTGIEFRPKAEHLFNDSEEVSFEDFWDRYHTIITEWKKTDKVPAEKYWNKLPKSEKKAAYDNIQKYYDSSPVIQGKKAVKKARTYLSDKNYNDEFKETKPLDINTIGIFRVAR